MRKNINLHKKYLIALQATRQVIKQFFNKNNVIIEHRNNKPYLVDLQVDNYNFYYFFETMNIIICENKINGYKYSYLNGKWRKII